MRDSEVKTHCGTRAMLSTLSCVSCVFVHCMLFMWNPLSQTRQHGAEGSGDTLPSQETLLQKAGGPQVGHCGRTSHVYNV